MKCSLFSFYCLPLRPKYIAKHPVLKYQVCFLNVADQNLDPCRTGGKIIVPCVSLCMFLGCVIDISLEMFVNMKYMFYFHRELPVYCN
jgi:hypothetical protein